MTFSADLRRRLTAHVAAGKVLEAELARTIGEAEAHSESCMTRSFAAATAGKSALADRLDRDGDAAFDRAEALRSLHQELADATATLSAELRALA